MRNVVFIGMPGCGKTTISQMAATSLGRPWFDSDRELEAAEGMSIPEIFAQKGEEYFRRMETECIAGLMRRKGAVIAVGGGAVERNREVIKDSSTVVYLRRSVESIRATLEPDTRPLLKDAESLSVLYERRRGIYETLSDITIDNEGGVEDTVKKVLEAIK